MKYILIILIVLTSARANSQIRAFDNSKQILPWIYNPSASISNDFQAYFGYDGKGNSTNTPQSFIAGLRMPVSFEKKNADNSNKLKGMMGLQLLNTTQSLYKDLNINLNYAQQVAISEHIKLALGLGIGIQNFDYDYDKLIYVDQRDPLFNNDAKYIDLQLNAGFTFSMYDQIFVHLAAPSLLNDNGINYEEFIVKASYLYTINNNLEIFASINLDTQNNNMMYGGDILVRIKKLISVVGGVDNYKYHGGVLMSLKTVNLGYTYGRNYQDFLKNLETHQVSLITNIPFKK